MRTGDSGGNRLSLPETQSRATAPLSFTQRHSRQSLTFGRDRKNAAKMVSKWQFHLMRGNRVYRRPMVLSAEGIVSRAWPSVTTSSDEWGSRWPGIEFVLTWTTEIFWGFGYDCVYVIGWKWRKRVLSEEGGKDWGKKLLGKKENG